jgi:hypothetical protein
MLSVALGLALLLNDPVVPDAPAPPAVALETVFEDPRAWMGSELRATFQHKDGCRSPGLFGCPASEQRKHGAYGEAETKS